MTFCAPFRRPLSNVPRILCRPGSTHQPSNNVMKIYGDMIKIALGRLDAGVAEMLLEPVRLPPYLKPTNREGVSKIMDTEPGKTGGLDILC